METKLSRAAHQAVLATTRRLDTEERVNAFLAHSRMMVAVYQAGQRLRSSPRR